MKKIIGVSTLFLWFFELFSQFQYGTTNMTQGSVTCSYRAVIQTTENNKVVERTIKEVQFQTKLWYSFALTSDEIEQNQGRARLPFVAAATNYSRTYNENESFGDKVPKFQTTLSYKEDHYMIDPCSEGNEELVLNRHLEGSGTVKDELRGVTVSIEGIKSETQFFIVKVFAGGGWGRIHDLVLQGNDLKKKEPDYDCKWHAVEGYTYSLSGPRTTNIFMNGTDLPDKFTGTNGEYKSKEDQSYQSTNETNHYKFFKIDTASIYDYLREMPPSKSFTMPGYHYNIIEDTESGKKDEYTETASVTITFGDINNKLWLSTANEEDYEKWLPTRRDEKGYVPLKVKAELKTDDPAKTDTIHFYLTQVSHYPGYCTNIPKQEKGKKTDNSADLYFSNTQSDGNIEYIDSFHVKTKSKVSTAIVDIDCYDYGAYAEIRAYASMKNVWGISKYDSTESLIIPKDENKNSIADKWEKEVGVYDKKLNATDDSDEMPKNQSENGDGYTLFEEYRGFEIMEEAIKNTGKRQKNGDYIRLDPNVKDAFIFDNTNHLFRTYYASNSPDELNWYFLMESQFMHEKAVVIEEKMKSGNGKQCIMDLKKKDHRWINYNTPENMRLKKHRVFFIMYSSTLEKGTVGAAYYEGEGTWLDMTEFILYKDIEVFRRQIFDNIPDRSKCTNPKCTFQERLTKAGLICPKCGSHLIKAKTYTQSQMEQIIKFQYEALIIHEIGHGLGLNHHRIGNGKYTDPNGTIYKVTYADYLKLPDDDPKKEIFESELNACGVNNCAMTYKFVRIEEFITDEILTNRQNRFCRYTDTYTDRWNVMQPADNCFRFISVK